MITVAGGTYFERCESPHWNEFYGSGGRAAVALSTLSRKVSLHTYVGPDGKANLEILGSTFGVAIYPTPIRRTVRFDYFHGLSKPTISKPDKPGTPIRLSGPTVLRFGFIEGDAVVDGDRVVYDPQSLSDPQPFGKNGSQARQLAVVANRTEGELLTREKDPHRVVQKLRSKSSAVVAVLKDGPFGALIATARSVQRVPAFKTGAVWPVGSGDVFAAAFAHFWGEAKMPPVRAARLASRATAFYCETRTLPLPRNLARLRAQRNLRPISPREPGRRRLVYLASPFFTLSQRWVVDEARAVLRGRHLKVFSPFHDVGHGLAGDVVPLDLKALDRADVVYAVIDGLDCGTVFEVGYARAKGIPVVAFVENESPEALKMIEGSGCVIEKDFTTSIYKTVWAALEK